MKIFQPADVLDVARLHKRIDACKRESHRWSGPGIEWLELSTSYVRFRRAGRGDTTVIIALDPPNVVEQCDRVIELLHNDFQVVVFEQPGFSFSYPKPGFRFEVAHYEAFLEELLTTLGAKQYIFSFPCVSTFYGMRVAAKRPDLVERALFLQAANWRDQYRWSRIVADAFTLMTLRVPGGRYLMKTPYLGQALGVAIETKFAPSTAPYVVYRGKKDKAKTASFVEPEQRVVANGGCNLMETFYQRFFDSDFAPRTLEQPVHLAWAVSDRSHFFSDRRGLLEYFRDAEYSEHTRCGHHFDVEEPQLNAKLLRDLASRRSATRAVPSGSNGHCVTS